MAYFISCDTLHICSLLQAWCAADAALRLEAPLPPPRPPALLPPALLACPQRLRTAGESAAAAALLCPAGSLSALAAVLSAQGQHTQAHARTEAALAAAATAVGDWEGVLAALDGAVAAVKREARQQRRAWAVQVRRYNNISNNNNNENNNDGKRAPPVRPALSAHAHLLLSVHALARSSAVASLSAAAGASYNAAVEGEYEGQAAAVVAAGLARARKLGNMRAAAVAAAEVEAERTRRAEARAAKGLASDDEDGDDDNADDGKVSEPGTSTGKSGDDKSTTKAAVIIVAEDDDSGDESANRAKLAVDSPSAAAAAAAVVTDAAADSDADSDAESGSDAGSEADPETEPHAPTNDANADPPPAADATAPPAKPESTAVTAAAPAPPALFFPPPLSLRRGFPAFAADAALAWTARATVGLLRHLLVRKLGRAMNIGRLGRGINAARNRNNNGYDDDEFDDCYHGSRDHDAGHDHSAVDGEESDDEATALAQAPAADWCPLLGLAASGYVVTPLVPTPDARRGAASISTVDVNSSAAVGLKSANDLSARDATARASRGRSATTARSVGAGQKAAASRPGTATRPGSSRAASSALTVASSTAASANASAVVQIPASVLAHWFDALTLPPHPSQSQDASYAAAVAATVGARARLLLSPLLTDVLNDLAAAPGQRFRFQQQQQHEVPENSTEGNCDDKNTNGSEGERGSARAVAGAVAAMLTSMRDVLEAGDVRLYRSQRERQQRAMDEQHEIQTRYQQELAARTGRAAPPPPAREIAPPLCLDDGELAAALHALPASFVVEMLTVAHRSQAALAAPAGAPLGAPLGTPFNPPLHTPPPQRAQTGLGEVAAAVGVLTTAARARAGVIVAAVARGE